MSQKTSAILTLVGGLLFLAAAGISAAGGKVNYGFMVVGLGVVVLGVVRLRKARQVE